MTLLLIGSSIKYVCVCFWGDGGLAFIRGICSGLLDGMWGVLVCFHLPSILGVKPASVYLPKVTLLPTSSLGLTSRCAESGCNPTLPGLPHCPTLKPEPTDHPFKPSALSNPLTFQTLSLARKGLPTNVRSHWSSRARRPLSAAGRGSQVDPTLAFCHQGDPQSKRPLFHLSTDAQAFLGDFGPGFCFVLFWGQGF